MRRELNDVVPGALAALATLSLLLSTLAACGGSSRTGSQTSAERSTPAATTAHVSGSPAGTSVPRPPTSSAGKPAVGGASSGTRSTAQPRLRGAITQFKSCARQHGVTIPGPAGNQSATARARFNAAVSACKGPLIAALKLTGAGAQKR
jgi:hypothetical protein